jgi:predicted RNA-binding Zn-ribbon protein involved in translation (DUF1610 family)
MSENLDKFLKTSKNQNWRACLICKGQMAQLREAFFKCKDCGVEIIADEKDMR